MPRGDGAGFLGRKRWENELGKSRLPCQCLSLVQRKFKEVFVFGEGLTELGKDAGFGAFDLRKDLSARSKTNAADRSVGRNVGTILNS